MVDLLDKQNFVYYRQNPEAVFFDNASTTHIHDCVLEQILDYYSGYRASPGRGGYTDSTRATQAVENSRKQVAKFLGVLPEQILFTTGATQGLNWIAKWNNHLPGNVIISEMEHNSNLVPWLSQGRTYQQGLEVIEGKFNYDTVNAIISRQKSVGLLSMTTKSNLTGKTLDWRMATMIAKAHEQKVALDFSQSVMMETDLLSLIEAPMFVSKNVDYAVFSAHKMFGPTGIGVLYVREPESHMPVYGGGGMVDDVCYQGYNIIDGLDAHQAGTPDTAGIIGMGMCCEMLSWYGSQYLERLEQIAQQLTDLGLLEIPELNFLGDAEDINNIFSFTSDVVDISDVATLLNEQGIAVRHGKMCAYPFANRVLNNKPDAGIMRISTAPYNDHSDCEKLVDVLKKTIHTLTA
jgi:cysteine desulfurase/selenocysteine lyase